MFFINIDFENSYDRIEWYFITNMIYVLSFDQYFINYVHMLVNNASIFLTLIKYQSKVIQIGCSVCQVYPLALSLFILVAEAFGYLLAHRVAQVQIQGIYLPNCYCHLINGYFVNNYFLRIREDD